MKDKEWLKERILESSYKSMGLYTNNSVVSTDLVIHYIDQLDEPEALSQEWINENKVARIDNLRKMTTSDVVPVEKLQNLIVPKQDKQEVEENFYTFDNAKKWLQDNGFVVFEKDKLDEEVQRMVDETYEATNEKPVIPQFVADYIERAKPRHDSLYQAMEERAGEEVNEWIQAFYNSDKFARAWLDGYEVEKEQQYYVMNKENELILGWSQSAYMTPCIEGYEYMKHNGRENLFQLTEKEIKDYDERYWVFAEEAKE